MSRSLFFSILAVFMFIGCFDNNGGQESMLEKIKKEKKIIVGVKDDVPKFGLYNSKSGKIEGFEADLAALLKHSLLGEEGELVLRAVNAKTRTAMLDSGAVDAVIATFTITEQRKKTFDFSAPYYDDYIGLLVLKEKGYQSFKDLADKTIGVAQGATTQATLESEAKKININVKIENYPDYATLKSALTAGRIDAFSVDKSILLGYVDDSSEILKDNFSKQSYGVVTSKKDSEWSEYVSNFVKSNQDKIGVLKEKWGLNN